MIVSILSPRLRCLAGDRSSDINECKSFSSKQHSIYSFSSFLKALVLLTFLIMKDSPHSLENTY